MLSHKVLHDMDVPLTRRLVSIGPFTSCGRDGGEWREAIFYRRGFGPLEASSIDSGVRRSAAARRVGVGRPAPTVPRGCYGPRLAESLSLGLTHVCVDP